MKGYRIDAYFRDKAGRELHRRCPIWTGHVDDAKAAIKQAHAAITADCNADARIDSISIQAKGEDGESVMTREFAEDFTIGYGASAADSSTLAGDGVKHELTPEQEAAAHERVKKAAVDALIGASPKIADELRARTHERQLDATAARDDGFGGFFDSFEKPKGETAAVPAGPFRGSGDPSGGAGPSVPGSGERHTVSAGPGCDKSIRDCKHKFDNIDHYGGQIGYPITPCPHTLGDAACGVQPASGGVVGRQRAFRGGVDPARIGSDNSVASVGPGTAHGLGRGATPGRPAGGSGVRGVGQTWEEALKRKGERLIEDIRQGIETTRRKGRTVNRVTVCAADLECIARALGADASRVPGNILHGVKLHLGGADQTPPEIESERRQKPIVFGTIKTLTGGIERLLSGEESERFRRLIQGEWPK